MKTVSGWKVVGDDSRGAGYTNLFLADDRKLAEQDAANLKISGGRLVGIFATELTEYQLQFAIANGAKKK